MSNRDDKSVRMTTGPQGYIVHTLLLLVSLLIASVLWSFTSYILLLATSDIPGIINKTTVLGLPYNSGVWLEGLNAFLVALFFIPWFLLLKDRVRVEYYWIPFVAFGFLVAAVYGLSAQAPFGSIKLVPGRQMIIYAVSGAMSGFIAWALYLLAARRIGMLDTENTPVDLDKRKVLASGVKVAAAAGVISVAVPFFRTLVPRQRLSLDIDLAKLDENKINVVEFQGRPVWILRRSKTMLAGLAKNNTLLRDAESSESEQPENCKNAWRSIKPEVFVAIGICTHLGCSPNYIVAGANKDIDSPLAKTGLFLCPCHGSIYDLAGRVIKGVPAPKNLEIPEYRFQDENTIRVYGLSAY